MAVARNKTYQLEQLFNDYYTTLLLYSLTIVKNREDAEDIVQRAFISLWQKMDALDIHTSARAYLYKSVYNGSLDWLKHKKIQQQHAREVQNSPVIPIVTSERKELQERIAIAINELPEQCRKIFTMNRYDGLRYKEIATILQLSEKTVENQMGKALKILRTKLTDYLPLLLLLLKCFYDHR